MVSVEEEEEKIERLEDKQRNFQYLKEKKLNN